MGFVCWLRLRPVSSLSRRVRILRWARRRQGIGGCGYCRMGAWRRGLSGWLGLRLRLTTDPTATEFDQAGLTPNCGSEPARDGGLAVDQGFVGWVHIRCCGNGCLGFRPYG